MAQTPPPPPPPPGSAGGGTYFQPRGIGEILSAAFDLYKQHWQSLIQIVAIVVIPLTIVQYVLRDQLTPSNADVVVNQTTGEVTVTNPSDFWGGLIGSLVFALLAFLIWQVLSGAIARAAAGSLVGETITPGDAFSYGFHRLGSILLIGLLVALIVTGGFLLFIVPGIIFAVKLSVSIPALIVENRRGTDAIGRSWNLTTGQFWHVLGTWFLAFVITWIVTGILGALGGSNAVLQGILGAIGSVITMPFLALVTVLIYLDLRVRKEGLSDETLRRELAASRS